MKEELPVARDLSLERPTDSYLSFRLALIHSVFYFVFLYQQHYLSFCTIFHVILSNMNKVLSINPSDDVLVFGNFNVHHKDWLTYSGENDRPGELCYSFSISNDLTQVVNIATWSPVCNSHSPALLDLFIFSDTSICSARTFCLFGNSDHVAVSISIDFPSISKGMSQFIK